MRVPRPPWPSAQTDRQDQRTHRATRRATSAPPCGRPSSRPWRPFLPYPVSADSSPLPQSPWLYSSRDYPRAALPYSAYPCFPASLRLCTSDAVIPGNRLALNAFPEGLDDEESGVVRVIGRYPSFTSHSPLATHHRFFYPPQIRGFFGVVAPLCSQLVYWITLIAAAPSPSCEKVCVQSRNPRPTPPVRIFSGITTLSPGISFSDAKLSNHVS